MIYSKTGTSITPHKLDDAALLAIGKLIRACAELEDLVSLALCELAEINESQSLILLGKMAVSKKLSLAITFANNPEDTEIIKSCFDNEHYNSIIRCRNAVAHGLFLGLTDQGSMAFRVTELLGAKDGKVSLLVHSYSQKDLDGFAAMAEGAVPQIEALLKLQTLRETRRQRGLLPHRKAQPTRAPSVKSNRPSTS